VVISQFRGLGRSLAYWLIGLAWVPLAQAQSEEGDVSPPPSPVPKALRFTVGFGYTNGGDDIVLPDRRGGPTLRIRAGQLQMSYAGIEYQTSPRLSTQVTLGLHLAVERNKLDPPDTRDVFFIRVPVEVLERYHITPRWNVAAGLRVALGAAVVDVQNATINTDRFNDAVSPVVETEFRYWPQVGIKLRYVSERFRLRHGAGSGNDRIDASHFGLLVGAYI
jgi:hypothetical protein